MGKLGELNIALTKQLTKCAEDISLFKNINDEFGKKKGEGIAFSRGNYK